MDSQKSSESFNRPIEETRQLSERVIIYPNRPLTQQKHVFKGIFANDLHTKLDCAVKFPRDKTQFIREINILKEIGNGSHVITFLDCGHFQDGFLNPPFIVLENCHKLNLHQFLMRSKETSPVFDVTMRFNICKQLIDGVTFIHDELVVHKDLKPSNVLLTEDLQCVKIADFGSCQKVPSFSSAVSCPEIFGTIGYRPPESYGDSYISLRTDTFSLGAMFYFILSNGESPFGEQEDMWDYNARYGITTMCDLKVPNRRTTKHLISSMLHIKRHRRPSIWEVFCHPCWSKSDVDFDHEYGIVEALVKPTVENFVPEEHDADEREKFLVALSDLSFSQNPSPQVPETSIAICNKHSSSLQLFKPGVTTLTNLHEYHNEMKPNFFSVVALGNHIYVLTHRKSVHRLICDGVRTRWQQMNDMLIYHGQYPPAVENHNAIYVVGKSGVSLSRSVSKFEPTSNTWIMLPDKIIPTASSAVVSLDNFIYSIGGAMDAIQNVTNAVEKINLISGTWKIVAPLNTARFEAAAVQYADNIFVFGGRGGGSTKLETVERYNPDIDQWTALSPMTKPRWGPRYRCHVINDVIYVVGGDGVQFGETIEKYDPFDGLWGNVEIDDHTIQIWASVEVKLPKPIN